MSSSASVTRPPLLLSVSKDYGHAPVPCRVERERISSFELKRLEAAELEAEAKLRRKIADLEQELVELRAQTAAVAGAGAVRGHEALVRLGEEAREKEAEVRAAKRLAMMARLGEASLMQP